MPRTAQLKKTSEERCREAFEATVTLSPKAEDAELRRAIRFGWDICWRYLEKAVTQEFIER